MLALPPWSSSSSYVSLDFPSDIARRLLELIVRAGIGRDAVVLFDDGPLARRRLGEVGGGVEVVELHAALDGGAEVLLDPLEVDPIWRDDPIRPLHPETGHPDMGGQDVGAEGRLEGVVDCAIRFGEEIEVIGVDADHPSLCQA